MINLLLLSAGTNANYQISKVIKTYFSNQIHLIGTDINPQHLIASSIYLDAFYQVPMTKEAAYYPAILDICQKQKIDYLLPSFDADQLLFFPENEDLIKLGVKSLGTPLESLKYYKNKAEMNVFLREEGFPIPKLYSVKECVDDILYMVKPINGVGSIGAGLKNGKEIKKLPNPNDYVIQERLFEPEVTMECFYFNNQFSCVCRERLATKAGVCQKARLFNNDTLAKIGLRFAKTLTTPFIFNLQFMQNQSGEYRITDVNLRTAGGMGLSYAAEWDEISALAKIMLKKETDDVFETLPEKIQPQYVVRAYTDIVTKIEKPVVAFDLDGTLLDSRKRHKIVLDDILKKYNIELDTSDLIEFKRNGKNNVNFLISKGLNEAKAKEIQQKWIENIENEEYLKLDILYSDTFEVLEQYSKDNDLILVTARNNKDGLQKQVRDLGIEKYFSTIKVVVPGKNVAHEKAQVLRDYSAILFIGDTLSDAQAARLTGIDFKFHENGFHAREVIG